MLGSDPGYCMVKASGSTAEPCAYLWFFMLVFQSFVTLAMHERSGFSASWQMFGISAVCWHGDEVLSSQASYITWISH